MKKLAEQYVQKMSTEQRKALVIRTNVKGGRAECM